jgi:hypothetical protein
MYLSRPLIRSTRLNFVVGYMRVGTDNPSRGLFMLTGLGDYCLWWWRWSIRIDRKDTTHA